MLGFIQVLILLCLTCFSLLWDTIPLPYLSRSEWLGNWLYDQAEESHRFDVRMYHNIVYHSLITQEHNQGL